MRFHVHYFVLLLLASSFAGSAVQVDDLAAGHDVEGSLTEKAERARALFKNHSYSEASVLARQVLLQKPDGRRSDELRVLLCKAKSNGEDVGDPAAVYPESGDPAYPNLMPPSAQPPEKIFGSKPRFDSKARRTSGRGQVIVTSFIDEDGCVQDPIVTRGLNERADQNVLKAVQNWVFRPALFHGKPIKVPYQLSVAVGFN